MTFATARFVAPPGARGMGEVYRARDARLDRDVAIKVLPVDVASDPDRVRRYDCNSMVEVWNHQTNGISL